MKAAAPQTLSALDETGSGLVLTFEWRDDRWAHTVRVAPCGESSALLSSIEGDVHADWPASPPFQQLSIEAVGPHTQVAFLVGMAGGSHWSGSVEALPGERALVFDIACRMNQTVERGDCFLGSSYSGSLPFHSQGNACEAALNQSSRLMFSAAESPSVKAQVRCVEKTLLTCQPAFCRNEKNSPQGDSGSSTIRWKYRLALQISGDCSI